MFYSTSESPGLIGRRFFYYVFHIQWQKYLFENVDFFAIWCGKRFAISIGQIQSKLIYWLVTYGPNGL